MKHAKWMFLLFFLSPYVYANSSLSFYEQMLKTPQRSAIKRLCKTSFLSYSCGNHKCEPGETYLNCPSDCDELGKNFSFETFKSGSYNGRTWCPNVQHVFDPKNLNDVLEAIAYAKDQNLRIKAIGASHTDNEAICTDGVMITSRNLTSIYGLETFEGLQTVNAQAGVTIGDLGKWLHDQNKSLGYGIVGFEKVRIAGVLGTGAHGSSILRSPLLSDRVVSVRMVLADGSIKEFTRNTTGVTDPNLWNALRVHLGMFGFIYDMRIEVEDDFQIISRTKKYSDEQLFSGESIWNFVKDCDTAHAHWFPNRQGKVLHDPGTVIVHCGEEIRKPYNDTWNDFSKKIDFDAQYTLHYPHVLSIEYKIYNELLHRGACSRRGSCLLEEIRKKELVKKPPYESRKGFLHKLRSHPHKGVRGWAHIMQNSHGSPQGNAFRQTDWEVAIPVSKAAEAFNIMKSIFADTDIESGTCLPLIGLYMRFGIVNSTLLSHAAQGGDFKLGEPVVFLEIPEFLPSFDIKTEEDKELVAGIMEYYERPFRTYIHTLVEKLGARVHWAKNRKELFSSSMKDPVRMQQLQVFSEQVDKLDPEHLFANEFSDLLGLSSLKD